MMELRPYQQEAAEAVRREWDAGHRKTLLVLPTGTGKTIVFCKLSEEEVIEGNRVLILAHREELLNQAADKMEKTTHLKCAREKAEDSCLDSWYRIVVGSVQTLQREKRLTQFPPNYFDTIIIDEAHHALADGYQTILDYFESARVLGVTATVDRGDKRDLGQYFDSLAYEYSLPQAIREGYLCPIKAMTIPLKLDITGVGIQNGDFKAAELGTALDPYLDQIAEVIAAQCQARKTVIFLPLIKTAQKMRDKLLAHGMRAAEVNGESEDRAQVLAAFERGEINVLCNALLLTEGWDCPSVDCVVMLRPTKQRGLYCQCVGRGTRLAPGKTELLLLDFLWLTERHQLCRPAHLMAKSDEVAQAMTRRLEEAAADPMQTEIDLMELEDTAQADVVAQREEALAKALAEMRHRKRALVDPLQFEMSIQAEDLSSYVPSFKWECEPPSEKQLKALEKAGIFPDEVENAGKAAKLLDKLALRRSCNLTTPKQIRFLEGKGFCHVGTWSFTEANRLITRIAANGWRVPAGIDPAHYRPAAMEAMTLEKIHAVRAAHGD